MDEASEVPETRTDVVPRWVLPGLPWIAGIALLLSILLLVSQLVACGLIIFGPKFTDPVVITAIATITTSVLTVAIVAIAVIAGVYTKEELETGQKIARGDFLLRLDEAFMHHKDVHANLAPGGDWHRGANGPKFPNDTFPVSSYMGLFERIKVLVDEGIIKIDTVDRLYSSRFFNILRNPTIYQSRLVANTSEWRDFIELWKAIKETRQKSNRQMPEDLPSLEDLLFKLSQQ